MIRFHNTLGGELEDFKPLVEGQVGLYTCGPTVYDFPHIGNYRAYVFEDLLKRFLLFTGFKVRHVMNITDVDDKTIRGANRDGVTLSVYTRKFIEAFYEDNARLRLLPADIYPLATEHIPEMTALIRGLLDKGIAYRKDGSIYFSISAFPDYGKLSGIRLDELKPGIRVETDEYEKESVHDFALWKAPKEGEPVWETEIGPGRPGWHIECSAMSSKYLGDTFDIHCGGIDNIFPHHENEIAQSEASSGKPFVRTWLHCHHLVVDGEKMSKSKGNQHTLKDLIGRGLDPLDIRFLLLSTHYRKTLNFTEEALEQSQSAKRRLLDFVSTMERGEFPDSLPSSPEFENVLENSRLRFIEGLSDDLNISNALSAIFDLARETNARAASGRLTAKEAGKAAERMRDFDRILAILPPPGIEDILPPGIAGKIEARQAARLNRDFAEADRLRKELLDAGIVIEDTKDGVRWKRADSAGGFSRFPGSR